MSNQPTFDRNDPQYQAYESGSADRAKVHPLAQTMRMSVFAIAGAVVIMTVIMSFVLIAGSFKLVPTVIGVVLALLAALLVQTSLAPKPFAAGERPDAKTVLAAFQTATFRRMIVAEVPFILTLVLCFVFQSTWLTLVPVAAICVFVLLTSVVPNRSVVARAEQAFDRQGAVSDLSKLFGY